LTAADIDPPPPLITHLTPYTLHRYIQYVDGIRIKRFAFESGRHEYYIIYKIKLYWGWLDFTGIIIYFEVE